MMFAVALSAGLFLAGCGQPPAAGSLGAPSGEAEVAPGGTPVNGATSAAMLEEYLRIAREFLPQGAALVAPQPLVAGKGGTTQPVLPADLDGDGNPELAIGYRLDPSTPVASLMVLRLDGDSWEQVWDKKGEGQGLERLQAVDITGDGRPELLVGWTIGASAGDDLSILTWREDTLAELTTTGYHRLEVADLATEYGRDGKAELAIWTKDTGDAFAVEVLRWDGTKLVPAANAYPAYFPQVVDYYEERVQKMPEAGAYWYYLADARLKAGDPQGALEAAEKDLALESPYPEPARILLVQGRALLTLGRYQEAVATLTGAMDGRNRGTKEDLEQNRHLPFPTRLMAEAYYYRGEAYLGLGDQVHAREDWTKARQMLPDWDQPQQALARLDLAAPAGVIATYWQGTTPETYPARLKGFSAWAAQQELPGEQKLSGHAVEAERGSPTSSDLPRVVLVDWTGEEGTGYAAHSLIWWQGDAVKSQVLYSVDASAHGLDQSRAVIQARLVQGPEGAPELGVVYDAAAGGSGSPQPVFYLWRLEGEKWRVVWRSDSGPGQWRNSHGTLVFTGPDLQEFTLQGDSWMVGDGKDEIFQEANPGPHRQFLDTWQWGEDSYRRVKAQPLPSAYNTLVELVYAMSTGNEEAARELVTDPSLIGQAKALGLVQKPLGQGWMLELDDPGVERGGPLRILDGPAAGVTVEFQEADGSYLVSGFKKDGQRLPPGATGALTRRLIF